MKTEILVLGVTFMIIGYLLGKTVELMVSEYLRNRKKIK